MDEVRAWDMAAIRGFRLTRSSGFEPGAHGLALAKLASHVKDELEVQCSFAETTHKTAGQRTLLAFAHAVERKASPDSSHASGSMSCFRRRRPTEREGLSLESFSRHPVSWNRATSLELALELCRRKVQASWLSACTAEVRSSAAEIVFTARSS